MATVKSFRLKGYVNDALCLSVDMRINSFKLAEKRFRARYEGVLVGSWRIDVLLDNKQVHSFMLNQLDLFQQNDKRNKTAPVKEQNSSPDNKGNKTAPSDKEQNSSFCGVNPCIQAGKLAMKVLIKNYSDGAIPTMTTGRGKAVPVIYLLDSNSWHGKGRRPRWLCDYEAKGGNLADIKINYDDC